jgi:serine/threonine-protein kinase
VFKVIAEQGINVCIGVADDTRRYFVKFAGAKPVNFETCNGNTVLAVEWLKNAVQTYKDLEHPTLIKYIESEEIGGGFVAVFDWTDATTIEPLNSPDYFKFMKMSVENKLQAFEDILNGS